MKQRAIGHGGSLEVVQPSSVYEKPKKAVPKKKLAPSDMKSTWLNPKMEVAEKDVEDGQDDKFASSARVYFVDNELVAFLKSFDVEDDENLLFGREYLLRGPPFKGKHDKHYKQSLKDLGLRWLPNPESVQGDYNIAFGWYVAHDVKELKTVLNMPRKMDGERAWMPCDMDEFQARAVDELVDKHAEFRKEREEQSRAAEDARRKAKNEALGRGNGVYEADLPHDIETIREYMVSGGFPDWEYNRELIASSAGCAALGPVTHTNAIRVIRGLRFNVITPAQVARGQWESDAVIAKRKRDNETSAERQRQRDEASTEEREEANLKRLKAKAERATQVLQRDDEINRPEEMDVEEVKQAAFLPKNYVYKLADTSLKTTTCHDCHVMLDEQFMDCLCTTRFWTKCSTCLVGFCKTQPCACATPNAN